MHGPPLVCMTRLGALGTREHQRGRQQPLPDAPGSRHACLQKKNGSMVESPVALHNEAQCGELAGPIAENGPLLFHARLHPVEALLHAKLNPSDPPYVLKLPCLS